MKCTKYCPSNLKKVEKYIRLYFSLIISSRCDIVESDECNTVMEQSCETVPKIQCDSTEKAACTTIQVNIPCI